jgi:hypothetical protein
VSEQPEEVQPLDAVESEIVNPPMSFECPECGALGVAPIHRLDCPTIQPPPEEA